LDDNAEVAANEETGPSTPPNIAGGTSNRGDSHERNLFPFDSIEDGLVKAGNVIFRKRLEWE
jgi:hypothetical protein